MSEKADYVRSQRQDRRHECHWPDCDRQVPPAMWGCKQHWFKLPKRLRDAIWAEYVPGQEGSVRNMTTVFEDIRYDPLKGERWYILEAFDKPSLRIRLLDNEILDGTYHEKLRLLIVIYGNWDCERSWQEELVHLVRMFFPFAVKRRVAYSHG